MRLAPSAIALGTVLLATPARPQSVARINVTPAAPSVLATQTLQLRAEAVDSAGKPVPGATIRFQGGSIFEDGVDQQGLVAGGAPGVLDVTVTALVPGQRPVVQRVKINVLPGPAASMVLEPRPTRLVVGQELKLRSKGADPGTVDVIDLTALEKVASIDVAQQAGGIDFWRSEAAAR